MSGKQIKCTQQRIIFVGAIEEVKKIQKGGSYFFVFLLISLILCSTLPVSGNILKDMLSFWVDLFFNVPYGLGIIGIGGAFLIILFTTKVIQPLRITERGIYPPTRGIVNIFLMRERFIPFSEIKEFRIYNPSVERFPEEWARMSKREREAREVLESEYDIVLKSGKVIKMNSWTTALYLSKNLRSVKKWREFRNILLKINEELKKEKTVMRREDIFPDEKEKVK